jgi:hypothetical protein
MSQKLLGAHALLADDRLKTYLNYYNDDEEENVIESKIDKTCVVTHTTTADGETCLNWSGQKDGKYVTSHGAADNTCGQYAHDQPWCYTESGWGNCGNESDSANPNLAAKIEIENVSSEADCYNKIFTRVLCEGPQTGDMWRSGPETFADHTPSNPYKPFGNPDINKLRFEYTKDRKCYLFPDPQSPSDFNSCESQYGDDAAIISKPGVVYNYAPGFPRDLSNTTRGGVPNTRGPEVASILKEYVNCETGTSTLFTAPPLNCGNGQWENNGTCSNKTRTSCPAGYGLYFSEDKDKDSKCFECPATMYSDGSGKCQMKTTSCGSGEKMMKYGVTRDDECYTISSDTAAQCLDPDDNRNWVIENGICREVVARPASQSTYDFCDDACQSKMVW